MELLQHLFDLAYFVVDFIIHVDQHLTELMHTFGPWMYVILFLIIFLETGFVITPFLPGDSLLFAAGALAALDGAPMNVWLLGVLLFVAAVIGDTVNYKIGNMIGPKVFTKNSRFLNQEHLIRTQVFYDRYGGKTIVFARFIPIIRTFAPFVAGIGAMAYEKFLFYNIFGAFAWIWLFLLGGYWLGGLPTIKNNFHIVIILIILISVAPAVIEFAREFLRNRAQSKNDQTLNS